MKKTGTLLCLLTLSFLLTGCWDKREMEDRGYVITMGIDATEDGTGYDMAFGVAQLSTLSTQGGNSGGEDAPPLIAVQGKSLASALREGNCKTSRQLYLGQCKTIVFGKGLLENKALLKGILEELERKEEVSPKTMVLGTNGKAEALVGQMLLEDGSTGMYLWEYYKTTADHLAVTKRVGLEDFLRELAEGQGQGILPLVSIKEGEITLGGGMYLREYVLEKELTPKEERSILFWKGEGEGAVLEERWKGDTVSFVVSNNGTQVGFYQEKGGIVCYIRPVLLGRIEGGGNLSKSVFSMESKQALEALFQQKIEEEVSEILETLRQKGEDTLERTYLREFGEPVLPFSVKVQAKVHIEGVGIIE